MIESKWKYQEFDQLPPMLPTIHSNLSVVISPDTFDHQLSPNKHRICAFPQLRDRSDIENDQPKWKREICFDIAYFLEYSPTIPTTTTTIATSSSSSSTLPLSLLQTSIASNHSWKWIEQKLEGIIPSPRVGAAFCYSATLRAIILHGGLTIETTTKANSLENLIEYISQLDELNCGPTNSSYTSTDSFYCLPILEDITLRNHNTLNLKMKTRYAPLTGIIPSLLF